MNCPIDQPIIESQPPSVDGASSSNQPPPTRGTSGAIAAPSDGGWLELRIWAEMFDDILKQRIAATNRAERGGVEPAIYEPHLEMLRHAENECRKDMVRCMRRVVPPELLRWQKLTIGIGEPMFARLLGHLGHPVHALPHHWEGTGSARRLVADEPYDRTLAQLWQFCGHGAPGRPRRGMTATELAALGNPTLKMLVHLNAEMCMKQSRSPFRTVYDEAKTAAADKLHTVECVRCGPSGKPAQPGTPWSKGHIHAHALRITGKEILRELWFVAGGRMIATLSTDHQAPEASTPGSSMLRVAHSTSPDADHFAGGPHVTTVGVGGTN